MNAPREASRILLGITLMSAVSSVAQLLASFEVASIKPYVSKGNPNAESSDTNVLPGGRFTGSNVTATKLIRMAFQMEDSRIFGAPGWVDSERYNIEAKTAGGVEVTRDNISQLMKSLLEGRFQLQYHRETREMPEYSLEVAKSGSKVKGHTGDAGPSMSNNSREGTMTLKATKISMADFAGNLTRQVGRNVVDNTGLKGEFDFDLLWSSDQSGEAAAPSIYTVLQGLGLRLVTTKGSVETIVIDHIEKASEN
jgi:uncharacterized protein (TIGR03435 family)